MTKDEIKVGTRLVWSRFARLDKTGTVKRITKTLLIVKTDAGDETRITRASMIPRGEWMTRAKIATEVEINEIRERYRLATELANKLYGLESCFRSLVVPGCRSLGHGVYSMPDNPRAEISTEAMSRSLERADEAIALIVQIKSDLKL